MLLFDLHQIGNKLFALRKRAGLTQQELAEAANLSDRTYADIERGETNMRVSTLLKLCEALHITPDTILTDHADEATPSLDEIIERLQRCSMADLNTALRLLNALFP
ncbi:MAG: helix-turn-helix transcriptional regulator [Oscillospiraceae bacterium]|nr:helix-turn-helix transcriptional regulator [Oscillospiraceae bacterium]